MAVFPGTWGQIFAGTIFRMLSFYRKKKRENLNLANISRYMVLQQVHETKWDY